MVQKPVAYTRMLIAMAGLPGTGKSAIAAALEKRLHALLLSKDDIRAQLFPRETINFSREQDDLCMEVIFVMAKYLLKTDPEQTIIIDGRTFSRSYQVEHLLSRAESLKVKPVIIECICEDIVAEQRLENDLQAGVHPAENRTYKLYQELKEKAEPIRAERLVLDTGKQPLERSLERCIVFLEKQGAGRPGC
jgi:adenylylsulfate kinase